MGEDLSLDGREADPNTDAVGRHAECRLQLGARPTRCFDPWP